VRRLNNTYVRIAIAAGIVVLALVIPAGALAGSAAGGVMA
jgi:hypothetical protein